MALDPVTNFAKCEVSTGYDDSATSVELSAGEGSKLPDPSSDGEFNLVWWNSSTYADPSDDPNKEIVRCTARSTDTLTITRAQEGTSASTKNSAGVYRMILSMTKKSYDDIVGATASIEEPTGTVDGSNVTFTVSNTPRFIVVDGMIRFENLGYTYSGGTITVDNMAPPTSFIRSFY